MNDLTVHFKYLALSTFVAYRALCNLETPVACIIVNKKTGKILSYGCNDTNASLNGTRHAEFVAIDKILSDYDLLGASPEALFDFWENLVLYVTVEPCVMCALALQQIGIREVYFGAANDRFGGNGSIIKVQLTQSASTYLSYGGIMRVEAVHLLRCFYIQENDTAPTPKIKKNKDIDGKPFPPNITFSRILSYSEFESFYEKHRTDIFFPGPKEDIEITPLVGKGYCFKDLVDVDTIRQIPDINGLYPRGSPEIDHDIKELNKILPFVKNDGKVGWSFESEHSPQS